MATEQNDDYEFSFEEAVDVISKAIERKKSEIETFKNKLSEEKDNDESVKIQELIDYLQADLNAYVAVLAEMTDDEELFDTVDADKEVVECPYKYDEYLNSLNADSLENELDADEIRAEYCDGMLCDLYTEMGERALKSKKMVKALLEDPYALSQIGDIIFNDDYLYDTFESIMAAENSKKKKKGKKKK